MNKSAFIMPLTAAAMLVASQFTANATDFGKVYGIPGGMTVANAANASIIHCKQEGLRPPVSFAQNSAKRGQANAEANTAAPANVTYNDFGNKVTLKWNAVNDASEYKIYEAGATASGAELLGTATTTSFDIIRDTDSGSDAITLFGVTAVTNGQESQISASPVLTVGPVAPLPWAESFRNGSTDKFFWTERTSDQQWGLLTDASGLTSVDGDNGLFAFRANNQGDYINLHTGKISLTGSPYLVFTRYYRPTQNISLTVVASFPDGTSAQVFQNINNGTAAAYWKAEIVDLTAYKQHRYCTLSFNFISNEDFGTDGALVALDAIQVIDNKKNDVAAELTLPTQVLKGQTISGHLKIINNSLHTTPDINVNVAANGKTIISGKLQNTLGSLATGMLPIEIPTSALMQDSDIEITAELTIDGDERPGNNNATHNVTLGQTWRGPVESLRAFRSTSNEISLKWEAPTGNRKTVTDGFENYTPWATEFGEWKTVDNDLAFHGGVYAVSDYPGQNTQFAFKVMTPEEIGEPNDAKTGRSYLGAPFGVLDDPDEGATYAASDAWLISPELSGEAHTGSFHAASTMAYNDWWGKFDETDESFYIMYSTTGNAPADFKGYCYAGSISNKVIVDSHYYTKIEFAIPEGARYFAIHHTTPGGEGCMLRLDDFSFIAGGTPLSYNVYADGTLLTTTEEPGCFDAEPSAVTYAVTAVYADGAESTPVEIESAQASIDLCESDTAVSGFDVYNLLGTAVLRGVTSVENAGLPPGIYIANGRKFVIK